MSDVQRSALLKSCFMAEKQMDEAAVFSHPWFLSGMLSQKTPLESFVLRFQQTIENR